MDVAGKVAVVTGAATGIGRVIAVRLGSEGAAVAVADVDEQSGNATAAAIERSGARAIFIGADISSEADVRALMERIESELGGLDIVVNNACEGRPPFFPEAPFESWSRVLDICLRGTMLMTQRGLELMERRGGGAVVNVASVAGLGTRPHAFPEYSAAKAAVVRLTSNLAPLALECNVRVNCVAPDWVLTENVRARRDGMSAEERAEQRDGFGRPAPDRFLEPDEIADAVLALVRDDSLAGRTLVCPCGRPPYLLPADRWD